MTLLSVVIAFYEPAVIALYNLKDLPTSCKRLDDLITLSFTTDLVTHLVAAFTAKTKNGEADAPTGCNVCEFALDLITVIPGWIGLLHFARGHELMISNPMMLLRLARLLQTSRMYRLSAMQRKLQAQLGYRMFVVDILKFMWITSFACHWLACAFLVAEGKVTDGAVSYKTTGPTWLSTLVEAKGDPCTPSVREDKRCQYLLAYYWAVTTLTTVGYGDASAQNEVEYGVVAIGMLIVGYTWALIVATIVSLLSALDPVTAEFRQTLDSITDLAKRRNLRGQLPIDLRTFVHETRHFMRLKNQRKLMQEYLSDGLQREIVIDSAEVGILQDKVSWIDSFSKDATLDIVRGMVPMALSPGEHVTLRQSMVLVQKGIIGFKGKPVSRGEVLGQYNILLDTPTLIDRSAPKALTLAELLRLSKGVLTMVARRYPEADKRLRRAQVRTAVFRGIVYHAQRKREEAKTLKPAATRARSSFGAHNQGQTLEQLTSLMAEALRKQDTIQLQLQELADDLHREHNSSDFGMSGAAKFAIDGAGGVARMAMDGTQGLVKAIRNYTV